MTFIKGSHLPLRILQNMSYRWLFLWSTTLFLAHQIWMQWINITLLDSYLDDLVFLPCIYSFITLLFQKVVHKQFTLPVYFCLSGLVLSSLATEWLFPQLSNLHTRDPLDVLAYAVGLEVFLVVRRMEISKLKK